MLVTMTLDRLKQYRDQKKELRRLEKNIAAACDKMPSAAPGLVKASWREHPYIEGHMSVYGIDVKQEEIRRRRIALMEHRQKKLYAECLEIEEWIAGLTDSRLRQIIELRFLKGHEWRKVAKAVYGAPGYEDAARKIVARYFEKVS
ncbi:MAG: hypothetical protein VB049_04935 [Candidatus Pelethousia sp.]|nr:hypothetical protein [Candidatus Pelethousia sp.]